MILFAVAYFGFVAFLLVVLGVATVVEWLSGRCVFELVSAWLGGGDDLESAWLLPCAPDPEMQP